MKVGQPSSNRPTSQEGKVVDRSIGPREEHTLMEGNKPNKNKQSMFGAQAVKQNTGKKVDNC